MMMRPGKDMLLRFATAVGLSLLVGTVAFAADPAPALPAQAPVAHPLKPGENGASETVLGPYLYDGAGNIKRIGRSLTEGGTPVSGQTGTDVYVYDQVNRLVSGSVRGGQGNQTYTYDAFGNRLSSSTSGVGCVFGPCEIPVAVEPLTNRLKTTGMAGSATYDASGNLTSIDGTAHQYSWDDAGMMTRAVDGTVVREFIYGPDDERLAIYDVPNGKWTWELRGTDAKVLREVTSTDGPEGKGTANWAWSKDYVYRDGLLLASVSVTGTYHYHLDHLGTPRLITDGGGARIAEHDDYPFGAEVANGTVENPQERMKFTGHERDTIVGDNHTLDYMHARFSNPSVGRFLSVDPTMDIAPAIREPQQWNRYSYVVNNPLKYADPDGKDKFMAWLLGGAYADVSTWDALKGALSPGEMLSAINQGRQDWAEDHRAATHGFSPVPTTKSEVAMQMVMMGPIGEFIGTSFGKLGTVVANQAGKITGFSGHAIDQIITRGVSPALLKAVTSKPMAVLEQSAGRKLFLTQEGAVVLDKGGKVVTAYTAKEFDKKILDVLERAAAKQ